MSMFGTLRNELWRRVALVGPKTVSRIKSLGQ